MSTNIRKNSKLVENVRKSLSAAKTVDSNIQQAGPSTKESLPTIKINKKKKRKPKKKVTDKSQVNGKKLSPALTDKVKRSAIVGSGDTDGSIKSVESFITIHVSRVDNLVDESTMKAYLAAKLSIDDNKIRCYNLVRKDVVASTVSRKAFRISVPSTHLEAVFYPKSWPAGVAVREFTYKKNNVGNFQGQRKPRKPPSVE